MHNGVKVIAADNLTVSAVIRLALSDYINRQLYAVRP